MVLTSPSRPSATSAAKQPVSKDLWQQIIDDRAAAPPAVQSTSQPSREASLLFVGPSQSGKSSLIQSYMFKDRDEVPRPTPSLDYRYTRTSMKDSLSEEKNLSHFWELGGGLLLLDLIAIPVTERTVRDSLCVLVMDASRTSSLIDETLNYVTRLRKQVDWLLTASGNKNLASTLKAQQRKRFGESHPDINRVTVMPVQTLLIVNKFDAINNSLQPEELRVLCATMRAIAHTNGCGLLFTSQQLKEQLNKNFRSRVSHHLMGSEKKPPAQFNHLDTINVPVGADSFAQIGTPSNSNASNGDVNPEKLLAEWREVFARYFPMQAKDRELAVNLEDLKLAPEPAIDKIVAIKTDELRRKQREIQLQEKLRATETKK